MPADDRSPDDSQRQALDAGPILELCFGAKLLFGKSTCKREVGDSAEYHRFEIGRVKRVLVRAIAAMTE